ncbi:MAG: hypothetical protein Q7V88_03940, partial [Actinomycetota bacterium]|nr:hypothetical protein [Actinomycetota bacterium]
VRELAVHVTRAVYSPKDMDDQSASRCEALGDEVAVLCSDRTPMATRLRALIDPRLMRQRLVGNS